MNKKIILIGLVLLLSISIATALEDTCYQYDTNGDCVLGGDDNMAQIDEAINGIRDHFDLNLYDDDWNNLGEIECPLSIWDVTGDGYLAGDDYSTIYGIFDTAITGDLVPIEAEQGVPKKLTLIYDGSNLIAKVTTDDYGFGYVPRGCIYVNIEGTKYLTDINGEIIIPMTLTCGKTYTATMQGNEQKRILDLSASYYSGDCSIDAPVSTGTSGGGGGNHEYVTTVPITPAPVIPKVNTPAPVAPAPVVEETPAANPTPVTATPTTGAAIINGITSNPGIAAGIAILAIAIITGTVFYFRKR